MLERLPGPRSMVSGPAGREEFSIALADATATAPEQAQSSLRVLAANYLLVLEQIEGLGDLSDPASVDMDALADLERMLSSPEVVEAARQLQAWSDRC